MPGTTYSANWLVASATYPAWQFAASAAHSGVKRNKLSGYGAGIRMRHADIQNQH